MIQSEFDAQLERFAKCPRPDRLSVGLVIEALKNARDIDLLVETRRANKENK